MRASGPRGGEIGREAGVGKIDLRSLSPAGQNLYVGLLAAWLSAYTVVPTFLRMNRGSCWEGPSPPHDIVVLP
jgi:hypothetical protein